MKEKATKAHETVRQTGADVKTIIKNGVRLIEAIALLVVAIHAIYDTLPSKHTVTVQSVALLTAGLIIGLRGMVEFLRHLANK